MHRLFLRMFTGFLQLYTVCAQASRKEEKKNEYFLGKEKFFCSGIFSKIF